MSVLFARCAKCKHYFLLNKMDKAPCGDCVYTTYRCRSAACAGEKGAARSINAHRSYWRGRGRGAGGHQ